MGHDPFAIHTTLTMGPPKDICISDMHIKIHNNGKDKNYTKEVEIKIILYLRSPQHETSAKRVTVLEKLRTTVLKKRDQKLFKSHDYKERKVLVSQRGTIRMQWSI